MKARRASPAARLGAMALAVCGGAWAQSDTASDIAPADIAAMFVAACIGHDSRAAAVIDWALARGFGPVGVAAALPPLLDGAAGTVLAMPASVGTVLLAAGDDDRCTVWAEQQSGPALRLALQRELDLLAAQGARLLPEAERHLMHAGQWRSLLQWRLQRSADTRELTLGAVTTLGNGVAAQALNLAPAGAVEAR